MGGYPKVHIRNLTAKVWQKGKDGLEKNPIKNSLHKFLIRPGVAASGWRRV
jgi:hypothetical protein